MNESPHTIPTFEKLVSSLKNDLQQIESIRIKRRNKTLFISTGILLFLGMLWLVGSSFTTFLFLWFVLVVFGVLGIGAIYWFQKEAVSEKYKFLIISPFVENLVENGIYWPKEGIPESDFIHSNLFEVPDKYTCEDLITGKIGETSISFSEVHAEKKRETYDQKGHKKTHWSDIFRGFIFVADFPKEFKCKIEIKRNKIFASKRNRVHLEDPEFEKCFNTYGTDQIEVRYILTPSIMRRIMELERKFGGKNMKISFHDSQILIAISDKTNHYEAGLWSSILNADKLRREYEIIKAFAGIVEDLNLNLRIWNK